LNLSAIELSDEDYILLGKGLKFCPKTKSHDKLKLAEEAFKFSRRLRLKEYFNNVLGEEETSEETYVEPNQQYNIPPFFNKKESHFTPSAGRDLYLDLYIEAITEEIIQSQNNTKMYSNISKAELSSLRKLARNTDIVIKKADKSSTIVIMNRSDYVSEVLRQLNDGNYYSKLESDPMDTVQNNVSECVNNLSREKDEAMHEFDTFPTEIRTPLFYILPKIHKKSDDNLPLKYPGRPIVSGCNSPTENISKYVDYILKPHMFNLPSFVKDSTDFINKIKHHKFKNQNSYLVTLDVSSLYTNIPHKDGIDACKHFLEKNKHSGRLSCDEIARLIQLVLENNHFKFDKDFYLQKMGTAMGSPMAPTYASLFMGKFEEEFINSINLKPTVWFRFLDDIFMIWDHSLEDLNTFIDNINKFHQNIKFTYTISKQSVSFLDIKISKTDSLDVATELFEKETNMHQYLDYTSCHPKKCKNSIPYSQAKRYRRIISDDTKFNESLKILGDQFMDRGYPSSVIKSAFDKVNALSQDQALESVEKDEKSVIPFTVFYNPSLPNIGRTVNRYWDLLKLSKEKSVRDVNENYTPIVAFKRPKNLSDYLIKSDLNVQDNIQGANSCNRPRCSHCKNINKGTQFTSHNTGETFNLRCNTTCKSDNVIYLITCTECNLQYVGQTSQQVSKRMNSHRFDVNNFTDPAFSSLVASHFNSNKHSLSNFSFMPIDIVRNTVNRLCKETFWIHRLKTLHPDGLNSKVLFDI
jgi:hypothetical protein